MSRKAALASTGARLVRLATDKSSATVTRTHSCFGSEDEGTPAQQAASDADSALGEDSTAVAEAEELRAVVECLEALQLQQRSPQQPNPRVDTLLAQVLADHPEWRGRMAVAAKSALIRRKILAAAPPGGHTSSMKHSTNLSADSFQDQRWSSSFSSSSMPSRSSSMPSRSIRDTVDGLHKDPTLFKAPSFSLSRSRRFEGLDESELGTPMELSSKISPGPGAYSKSLPRGPAFKDGWEKVVLGANHTCPWKTALGRQINPVHVDATSLPSAPAYSFSSSRRAASDPYLQTQTPLPKPGHSKAPSLQFGSKRACSTGTLPRVRCIPAPPRLYESEGAAIMATSATSTAEPQQPEITSFERPTMMR